MKTYILVISLFFVTILSVNNSYAQAQDSLKQKQIRFYSKVLSASRDTAQMVAAIMDTYKQGVKKIVADATLSDNVRRVKIDELITDKNQKLGLLLSAAQQAKIIPTTERTQKQTGK